MHAHLARLNYAIDEEVSQLLSAYCRHTVRKHADVARQVILDYLDETTPPLSAPLDTHPVDKRADLWLAPNTQALLDERVCKEGHSSRSALINHLLRAFLCSRPVPKTVTVTLELPFELWERVASKGDVREVILRALAADCESAKECV